MNDDTQDQRELTISALAARVDQLSNLLTEVDGRLRALEERSATSTTDLQLPIRPASANPRCPDAGNALRQYMAYDQCLTAQQPLDSSVSWTRRQPADESGPGYVRTILSLLAEGQGNNSYPWPLYVQVRATPQSSATIASANAFGVNTRLLNQGAGLGACYFADLQHAGDGTDVGYDVELISKGGTGRTIGVNILNAGDPADPSSSSFNGSSAINIQTQIPDKGWDTGLRFEENARGGLAGNRGIGWRVATAPD